MAFVDAEFEVSDFSEGFAASACSASIDAEDDETVVGEVVCPAKFPSVKYGLDIRAAVLHNNSRILFCGVEVRRNDSVCIEFDRVFCSEGEESFVNSAIFFDFIQQPLIVVYDSDKVIMDVVYSEIVGSLSAGKMQ